MITFAICDDDIRFSALLWRRVFDLCARYMPDDIEHQLLPPFISGDEVIAYLKSSDISILFLDIDMPRVNGFETAAKIREISRDSLIIFVSAFDDFVYNSFDYAPFRFIRKGHLDKELSPTFQKAIEKCITREQITEFKTSDGKMICRISDIVFLESDHNYFDLHLSSGDSYKCRGTLAKAQSELERYGFFRVHSAYLINMEQIERTSRGSVIMKGGKEIIISRRNISNFEERYLMIMRKRVKNT